MPVINNRHLLNDLIIILLPNIFNNPGNTLPATNTGSYDTIFFIQPFHIIGDLDGKFGAGAAQWMAQRNGDRKSVV